MQELGCKMNKTSQVSFVLIKILIAMHLLPKQTKLEHILEQVTLSTKEPNAGKLGPTWEGLY